MNAVKDLSVSNKSYNNLSGISGSWNRQGKMMWAMYLITISNRPDGALLGWYVGITNHPVVRLREHLRFLTETIGGHIPISVVVC